MTSFAVSLLLALVVAWLTAATTAVRSVSRIWLRHWTERRLLAEGPAQLSVERPRRMLLAGGTGIAATVFALGALLGLREDREPLVQSLVVAVLLLLVVGQLVPRAIARRWCTALFPALTPALRALEWLLAPLFAFSSQLTRRLRVRAAPATRDPLEDLLREGELEGVGEAAESAIISGVVEFGEKHSGDVMTPRSAIVAVDRTLPSDEITRVLTRSAYTRIPVYAGDLDHIIGLLHAFDVLARPASPLSSLRRVATARPDTPCHDLMRRMLRERTHLAIIQGAAGETLGLVTLEDLVEELVGDISDEHDEPRPGAAP